jgi:hypothetical protein
MIVACHTVLLQQTGILGFKVLLSVAVVARSFTTTFTVLWRCRQQIVEGYHGGDDDVGGGGENADMPQLGARRVPKRPFGEAVQTPSIGASPWWAVELPGNDLTAGLLNKTRTYDNAEVRSVIDFLGVLCTEHIEVKQLPIYGHRFSFKGRSIRRRLILLTCIFFGLTLHEAHDDLRGLTVRERAINLVNGMDLGLTWPPGQDSVFDEMFALMNKSLWVKWHIEIAGLVFCCMAFLSDVIACGCGYWFEPSNQTTIKYWVRWSRFISIWCIRMSMALLIIAVCYTTYLFQTY